MKRRADDAAVDFPSPQKRAAMKRRLAGLRFFIARTDYDALPPGQIEELVAVADDLEYALAFFADVARRSRAAQMRTP